jgi:four helix bundle protein
MRQRAPMGRGVDRFTRLRAWQACDVYKKAIYRVCEEPPLASDWKRRGQLEESVRGPGAHLAEGYGRFTPPDFARFAVIARACLMESQNHLRDLVDRGYISDERRVSLNALRGGARTGERAARVPAIARSAQKRPSRTRTPNPELRTPNSEPGTELQNTNREVRTRKSELPQKILKHLRP